MKLNKTVACLFFAITPFFAAAQYSKPDVKFPPGEEYIYPIYPGKPGSLAGTMGELRSTHFHSGIDIRTNNMIGLPVVASKSGYISRVSVTPSGYGNIIYITHPDGNTTLYAHLEKFKGKLARHILEEQYKQKAFPIDLYFNENQFKVKQGDTIALSGNTGSSSGPHLHFDIRDKNNYALDPLKVASFPEVPDNLPPAAEKIALRTLDINSRINDRFGRFEFYAAKSGNNYTIASPILASGVLGIEIIAKDRLAPKSPFYGGVNYIEVRVDSQLVFNQAIDKVDISETRAIYTIMDFKTMRNKGTRFYKLYIDDGNSLKFYDQSPGNGKIKINPGRDTKIKITLRDSYGNKSDVNFSIRPSAVMKEVKTLEAMTTDVISDINENVFMVTARPCADSTLAATTMYIKGNGVPLEPDYQNINRKVYLVDLRKNLPDSIVTCGKTIVTNLREVVPSGIEYKYYGEHMDVTIPSGALYDTLFLTERYQPAGANAEIFGIGDRTVPLNKSISLSLKPTKNYPKDPTISVYRMVGKSYSYIGGEWINGRINFNTREFGDFTIMKDDIAPTIKVVHADRMSVRFKIRDNLSGINTYEANINGEWLLMHYDSKSATIWSEKLNNKPLTGNFQLVVTDNAGNQATFNKKIL